MKFKIGNVEYKFRFVLIYSFCYISNCLEVVVFFFENFVIFRDFFIIVNLFICLVLVLEIRVFCLLISFFCDYF